FAAHARYFFARFLLLTAPEQDEHHQHARLDHTWIDRERLVEGGFGAFAVLGAAVTLENAIDVSGAQAVMGQREGGIELNRALKVFDGGVAVFRCNRAKDEARKTIATAQILFVSGGALRRGVGNADLLGGTEFRPQAFDEG